MAIKNPGHANGQNLATLAKHLDLLDVGVGLFDEALRLIECNALFGELRGYPKGLCRLGVAMAALLEHNARRSVRSPTTACGTSPGSPVRPSSGAPTDAS